MKERDSNIELLRIIATIFILIVHCNGWFLQEWGGISTWSADRDFFVGLTRATIQSITYIGVDLFVLMYLLSEYKQFLRFNNDDISVTFCIGKLII